MSVNLQRGFLQIVKFLALLSVLRIRIRLDPDLFGRIQIFFCFHQLILGQTPDLYSSRTQNIFFIQLWTINSPKKRIIKLWDWFGSGCLIRSDPEYNALNPQHSVLRLVVHYLIPNVYFYIPPPTLSRRLCLIFHRFPSFFVSFRC